MFRMRLIVCLCAVGLLAGCSGKAGPGSDPASPQAAPLPAAPAGAPAAPSPGAEPAPPAAARTEADGLFPVKDLQVHFGISDYLKAVVKTPEYLLAEQDRRIAVANGRPYAQWILNDQGVWRPDPKGGGALLRYLPAKLKPEVWKQVSGDAEVWFRLEKPAKEHGCYAPPPLNSPLGEACWQLTVLNRGERLTYLFAPGFGPIEARAENYGKPEDSFYKDAILGEDRALTREERLALVVQIPRPTGKPAPVQPATDADFEATISRFPGVRSVKADLDGDGRMETVRGQLDRWSAAALDFLSDEGKLLGRSWSYSSNAFLYTLARFDGEKQTRLYGLERSAHGTDTAFYTQITAGAQWRYYAWSFDGKANTPASRLRTSADGTVTIEWDMDDPARHTRIREYKGGKRVAERFAPTGPTLVYPAAHKELLQAAFVARWMGLTDELPRYFASPEAAQAFARHSFMQGSLVDRPGAVEFATASITDLPKCVLTTKPAAVLAGGATPFFATWGGYEWWGHGWGQVEFGADSQGRLTIRKLTVEGSCRGSL